jgi:NADPH:quinone reductase-like Zn-dependent oxidoreductase
VTSVGKDVTVAIGTLVTFYYDSTWAEYVAVPAERLIPLPANYPPEKASQFQNAITAWDLLEESKVQAGQWLVLTAGNSSVSTQVLQFARQRGVNVICIVREALKHLDLKALGATEVIELKLNDRIGDRIGEITGNSGANAVIDCVGGPLLSELVPSLVPWGGQVIIYGGYSSERFELHNFDVLMKGITIKPYVYRYFFSSPQKEDFTELDRIAEAFGRPDFKVSVGGVHALEDFTTAIYESIHHPENGKRFFKMHS